MFRCFAILNCDIRFCFFDVLRRLKCSCQVFFEGFFDRLRRFLRFVFIVTCIRNDTERRVKEASRCQMACFICGFFRIFRTNRFFPYQLIGARLIGRNQRFVAIFHAISEGQEDSRCECQLAIGLRHRIVECLSACQCGSAAQLLRVGRIGCAFG